MWEVTIVVSTPGRAYADQKNDPPNDQNFEKKIGLNKKNTPST